MYNKIILIVIFMYGCCNAKISKCSSFIVQEIILFFTDSRPISLTADYHNDDNGKDYHVNTYIKVRFLRSFSSVTL